MRPAVSLLQAGKAYRRRDPRRVGSLKGALAMGQSLFRKAERFWPFRNLSLEVLPGEALGVIGPNGAGKTSLLRVIGGILPLDEGTLAVNGRLGGLLELGAGYSGDLTGRDNATFNGVIAGLTRSEVDARMADIVEFAELQHAIDAPLRTYSAGMRLRLAFSVAVHAEPEVLLVDEVLAVGDVGFQKRCIERVEELRERGCALVLVSHEPEVIRRHCSKVLWLSPDQTPVLGPAELVTNEFVASFSRETERRTKDTSSTRILPGGTELTTGVNRMGSLELELRVVRFVGHDTERASVGLGSSVTLEFEYAKHAAVDAAVCSVAFVRDSKKVLVVHCPCGDGAEIPLRDVGQLRLALPDLALMPGEYDVEVGLYPPDWRYAYDCHWEVYRLTVTGDGGEGYLRIPVSWSER
jgi:lipopolysaccharide transport system ATP-binding protein